MGCLDYVYPMKIDLLKRSFVALLILALASAWQIAPSFATQPCDMDNGTALVASRSCIDGHCKSVAGDFTRATICCRISKNLAMPSVPSVTPTNWDRVAYPDDFQSLIGRRLEPDLHPPPLTSSGVCATFERCDRVNLLESARAATAHAGRPSPGIGNPHDRRCFSTPHWGEM